MSAIFEISGLNVYIQIVVTIISIAVHLFATRNKRRAESALELITLYTIGLAGWFTITSGFFGHIIYADEVAISIGWPLHSGFQMELAFAAIGIGIVGFGGFWNKSFWLPFIIAKTSFMLGAGITHIIHMVQDNNFSPSNTGIILYWDILLPIILIALYIFYRLEQSVLQQ
ncbi:MAG: hypothetical protein IH588_08295 [Anaerolineales bacterium]|nr:hypothetical protein [Anaerolineales bacterium]